MSLSDALKRAGLGISPGDVWLVDDRAVVIPETPPEKRTIHAAGRTCVVLSNETICKSIHCPTISIAPTTHYTGSKTEADYVIKKSGQNGLDLDSCAMLGHIQPVVKTRLKTKIGILSLDDWENIIAKILWNFDR